MNKLYSLIKACMTSDMNLFKIKTKNNKKSNKILVLFIALCFMMSIGSYAYMMIEKLAPMNLQYIVLSLFVFIISIITIMEGIYKTSSLIFNCKDDQLLLSLPIKKSTVLFVRTFKFYVFELLFNSLFIIPLIVVYAFSIKTLEWTFFLTSFVMIFMLPIIPIAISLFIGAITSSVSSRFKYKNMAQIIISLIFILGVMYLSYNIEPLFEYLTKNATSINDLISKIYYPAGVYANLAIKFNFIELLKFIFINVIILIITIYIISKVYFKINSRLKKVTTTKKINVSKLKIESKPVYISLIKKELNTFFNTPVLIINAGFGLILFLIISIMASIKFDGVLDVILNTEGVNISKDLIISNIPLVVFGFILLTSFMTSITSSMISIEGKNINIIKSMPIKTKTILMSKIYSALLLTTSVLVIGDIILFVGLKLGIVELILLILLSILLPLTSHFIGLLVNLRYPKLDAENSTEVVKQSTSSFVSVMIGMILLVVNIYAVIKIMIFLKPIVILIIFTLAYILINYILYMYLIKKGVKEFNELSI